MPNPAKSMTPRAIRRRARQARTMGKGGAQPTVHERRGGTTMSRPRPGRNPRQEYTIQRDANGKPIHQYCFICGAVHGYHRPGSSVPTTT